MKRMLSYYMMTVTMGFSHPSLVRAESSCGCEIEVDPIAFAFKGYSGHLGKTLGSWKLDLGLAAEAFSESETKSLLGNNHFRAAFRSYGTKIDYIGPSQTGFHLGIQEDVSLWTYTSSIDGDSAKSAVLTYGPRLGYRFGSGPLYIDPWLAVLADKASKVNVPVGTQTYHSPAFQIFPTVHIGFRF